MTATKSKSDKVKKEGKVISANRPLSSLLDTVLQDHYARRQAYHGEAFVGNHMQIMLKVYVTLFSFNPHEPEAARKAPYPAMGVTLPKYNEETVLAEELKRQERLEITKQIEKLREKVANMGTTETTLEKDTTKWMLCNNQNDHRTCWTCGGLGHIASKCPSNLDTPWAYGGGGYEQRRGGGGGI
ncbi:hypothetical protein Bbelb_374670 [Branchiostoma belcheri]|nr:hypothetical protein Bbelb_374670 [Branchiostoma belcheri]